MPRSAGEEESAAFGEPRGQQQWHEQRLAPGRDAPGRLQQTRLAIDEGQRERPGDPRQPGHAPRGRKPGGEEQRRGPRLAAHPRGPRIPENVERTQRPTQFQRNANEPEADQREPRQHQRGQRRSARPRQGGENDEPGAGAAADEVARSAPVPASLLPRFRAVVRVAAGGIGHWCAPTLAAAAAALPPEGALFAPWDGPAALMARIPSHPRGNRSRARCRAPRASGNADSRR